MSRWFLGFLFGFTSTLIALTIGSQEAQAASLNFNSLASGEVVSTQFAGQGVTISAINPNQPFDLAVAFDGDDPAAAAADPDLVGPFSSGNLAGQDVGNLLIVAENNVDGNSDGLIDSPDDQGSGSGATFVLDFAMSVASFGFDLIDIDADETGEIRLFGASGVTSFLFRDLPGPTVFGDNSANRVDPLIAGSEGWDRVEIELSRSGAIANVNFTVVPEPASGLAVALGLAGLAGWRRRRLRAASPARSARNPHSS